MKLRSLLVLGVCWFGVTSGFAQGGGKAEPKRIHFAAGKISATLTGTLSDSQEMEYVFSAAKGQKITLKNTKTGLFDFRVFNDAFGFETEFDSSSTLTFEIPETGDYLLFIRKKMTRTSRRARYFLTLIIR